MNADYYTCLPYFKWVSMLSLSTVYLQRIPKGSKDTYAFWKEINPFFDLVDLGIGHKTPYLNVFYAYFRCGSSTRRVYPPPTSRRGQKQERKKRQNKRRYGAKQSIRPGSLFFAQPLSEMTYVGYQIIRKPVPHNSKLIEYSGLTLQL